MDENIYLIIEGCGWLGAGLLLSGYILSSMPNVRMSKMQFTILNFFGSFLLVINATYNKVYPFAVINIFWLITSAINIYRYKKAAPRVAS